ncbi:hypothetical protein M758_3G147700 [Ceratodon purpureus]|uniref:Uncharacterized protein n=1 Tax=Ceratodon purpureus TaxID=3225 RepID=A0A8T0ILV1_CERPU|nr:hypothetical protein KC19_3G146500 [Ceratodon purpureus]KAG0583557.1 hypothetical protein KC19_3G146500 [Ceratodon purpureus]KAG0583558.1 hypothetical protein KC19_3G146500 [Ceratodon purpureus]KAG0623081.1 hypothetical protein M758_3G147700 [Ceratodon purpureus]KAG0623082.1 hypothetical protein M758_3G147700 [Ceratodon purpureus]
MGPESVAMDSGEKRLLDLGYKQELRRTLSLISNFAFTSAIICPFSGITVLFTISLTYGGTISFTWGWLIVGFFTLCIGASMAEICSAYPTSGGLYFWSAQLAGLKWKPFAAWITGWFNVVGQWAGTCSAMFALAQVLQIIVLLSTGGANGGGYILSRNQIVGVHGGLLVSLGLLNSFPIQWLDYIGLFSVVWQLIGTAFLIVIIPAVAKERQSASFVWTSFNVVPELGLPSRPYVFLLGLLASHFALVGFDMSAHMTEETKRSDKNGAYGILSSLAIAIVVGYAYILALSFVMMDPAALLDPGNDAGGYAVAQLFYELFKSRYGSGTGGILCIGIVAVSIYVGGVAGVLSNSRMVFAFSRDGALPFSKLWHKVNRHDVPINAVWLSVVIAFIMVLPSLGSLVAFQAIVSIATVALYISYALPTLFRITAARRTFEPGPVTLGPRWVSLTIGWVAVVWVGIITVLFSLPVAYPVTKQTLNYTPVAVGGLFVLVVVSWVVYAHKWFQGPHSNLDSSSRPHDGGNSKLVYA